MRFRVISDLHVDYNDDYPFGLPEGDDAFTVVCGDTSGCPETTVDWIKKNVRRGVLVSGNHLPYCNRKGSERPMDELRRVLADAFPAGADVTYLDVETGTFKKVVDGVMFLGSCCYTDMRIRHGTWNPDGDPAVNRECSEYNMNDYRYGYTAVKQGLVRMRAADYERWFGRALAAFDAELAANEKSADPLPAVVVTHHPLVPEFLTRSFYVEDAGAIWSRREFNWASYASDMRGWFESHPSVRCHCCGHIHAVEKEWRHFKMERKDAGPLLVVNNARGYVSQGHAADFNSGTFVDTDSWEVVEEPLSEKELAERKKVEEAVRRNLAWLI